MPTLLACLSSGKGTWSEVLKIVNAKEWNKIFLITNEFGRENFQNNRPSIELIVIDTFNPDSSTMAKAIIKQLQGKISDFEIALNFTSGTGKEHMALLEAVLQLGLNFRLITLKNGEIEVMGMER